MILDAKLELSDGQAVTASAASTNQIDAGKADNSRAIGDDLFMHVQVTEDFATLTSLTISLQDSADNATYKDVALSPAILLADLVEGAKVFSVKIPKPLRRYRRAYYTVAGTNASAGKIDAWFGSDVQSEVA